MGNSYVREREMSFIAQNLFEPPKEDEEIPANAERIASPVLNNAVAAANVAPVAAPAQAPANVSKPTEIKPAE